MPKASTVAEIPLADAAMRIRKSYQAALAMMLRGELAGRRDERGRWMVLVDSVDRFLAA